jgi:hypothetical protein
MHIQMGRSNDRHHRPSNNGEFDPPFVAAARSPPIGLSGAAHSACMRRSRASVAELRQADHPSHNPSSGGVEIPAAARGRCGDRPECSDRPSSRGRRHRRAGAADNPNTPPQRAAVIDALLAAVTTEAERRGRRPPSPAKEKPVADAKPQRRQEGAEDGAGSLTTGKLNAVRAAFKAGVKPSAIARQFGLS